MQVAIVGTGRLALATSRALIDRGHVVRSAALRDLSIGALADVSLDADEPAGARLRRALRSLAPAETDCLMLLSGNDAVDVLAAAVGRSLGFRRVVPRLAEFGLARICARLGIDEALHAPRHGRLQLVRISSAPTAEGGGGGPPAPRGPQRLVVCAVEPDGAPRPAELPPGVRPVARVRDGALELLDVGDRPRPGDELVLLSPPSRVRELTSLLAQPGRG